MPAGTEKPQGYKFGWLVAVGGLSNLGNPGLVDSWTALLATGGVTLAGVVTAWSVVNGVAAAAIRPWSWYVLLGCHALGLAWVGLYAAFVAPVWSDVAVAVGVGVPYSVLGFAYFHRRRAAFGARGRWRALERAWPRIVGPEVADPGSPRGFTALPLGQKILVVVVVALLVLIGRA